MAEVGKEGDWIIILISNSLKGKTLDRCSCQNVSYDEMLKCISVLSEKSMYVFIEKTPKVKANTLMYRTD